MSSINSVGGSYSSSAYSQAQGAGGRHGHGPQRLENDLTSFLTQQGVSSDEQSQILSEVKSQLSSQRSSSSTRPDRTQLIDTVSSVLQSHGLDGDKFAQSIPAPPERGGAQAPPPPPPPGSDEDSQDALKQLLDLLAKAWKKALKQNESSGSSSSSAATSSDTASINSSTSASSTTSATQNNDSSSPYQAIIELTASQGELNQLV